MKITDVLMDLATAAAREGVEIKSVSLVEKLFDELRNALKADSETKELKFFFLPGELR